MFLQVNYSNFLVAEEDVHDAIHGSVAQSHIFTSEGLGEAIGVILKADPSHLLGFAHFVMGGIFYGGGVSP